MPDLAQRLGVPFPLFAFSHCRDVVAAVSRAGGFGVLGIVNFAPEALEQELAWLDAHVEGKPKDLATYWVGQGVGLIDQVRPAARVVQDFREDFAEAFEYMEAFVARRGA